MTAVDLSILNSRIRALQLFWNTPDSYISKLEDLLNMYSAEKNRLGESVVPQTLLPQKNVPSIVLEKIVETFPVLTQEFTENAMIILDSLWKKDKLEYKLLAINLLLCLPPNKTNEINKRLPQWIASLDEDFLQDTLLAHLPLYSQKNTVSAQYFIERLISLEDENLSKLAFKSLTTIIEQKEFYDLPWVFRFITPFIEEASLRYYRVLNSVISALIKKSEIETTAFLCDLYRQTQSRKAKKFIHKTTPLFSSENQAFLNEIFKKES